MRSGRRAWGGLQPSGGRTRCGLGLPHRLPHLLPDPVLAVHNSCNLRAEVTESA
jgi:hypothetical protein